MIKKLQRRFIVIAMCSMALVLIIIMGVINYANYREMSTDADKILELIAENGGSFFGNDALGMKPDPGSQDQQPSDVPQAVFDKSHGMSEETPYQTRYFSVTLDEELNTVSVDTLNIAAVTDDEAVEYALRCVDDRDGRGYLGNYKYLVTETDSGKMVIFIDRTQEISSVRTFMETSALVSLAGMAAVLLLVIVLSKRAIKPVAESYEKQKRFITDAGHELKTPLTIIDANTEVLEMEQGENRWTQSTRNQVKRLAKLTESLVALTRMDESDDPLTAVDFSLSDAVLETAEPFAAPASTAGKTLELDIDRQITYSGDEQSIRRLVTILLDNAIKYSSPGAAIRLSLKKQGKYCAITCKNPVDSIEKGNLDMLFERFYRGDTSRSGSTGGFGIGLSMAQSIVTAHKGKISARSEDGRSIVITALIG